MPVDSVFQIPFSSDSFQWKGFSRILKDSQGASSGFDKGTDLVEGLQRHRRLHLFLQLKRACGIGPFLRLFKPGRKLWASGRARNAQPWAEIQPPPSVNGRVTGRRVFIRTCGIGTIPTEFTFKVSCFLSALLPIECATTKTVNRPDRVLLIQNFCFVSIISVWFLSLFFSFRFCFQFCRRSAAANQISGLLHRKSFMKNKNKINKINSSKK